MWGTALSSSVRVLKVAFGVMMLLLFVAVPLVFALVRFYEVAVSDWQFVEVEVEVVDEEGLPAGPVHVAAFELADGGPKLLAEGRASASGTFNRIEGFKEVDRRARRLDEDLRTHQPLDPSHR